MFQLSDKLPGKNMRSTYLDVFCLFAFTLVSSLLSNQALWIGRTIGFRLKNVLIAELTAKTLRRRGKGSHKESGNENDDEDSSLDANSSASDGKVMNVLTSDFNRVTEVTAYLDDVYGVPLTLGIGIWYMYQLLGVSALIGLSLGAAYLPASKVLYDRFSKVWNKIYSLSDKRITAVTELLQGIKAVKLFGWESRFIEGVDEKRKRQLDYSWTALYWQMGIGAVSYICPTVILTVTMFVYVVGFGYKITAEIAFTSISVFSLVHNSFLQLPSYITWATSTYVALKRIDSYLSQPQVQDLEARVTVDSNNALGFECADLEWDGHGGYECSEEPAEAIVSPTTSANTSGALIGSSNIESLVITSPPTEETPLLFCQSPKEVVLSPIESTASLINQTNNVFSLKNINVQFPIGGLSIVAGPTGSGKSSLLSALIGEMTLTRGR
ncbi:hypothetical protein GGI25_006117, partial [Coemansia spiralis]